jgi:hypothetical protein
VVGGAGDAARGMGTGDGARGMDERIPVVVEAGMGEEARGTGLGDGGALNADSAGEGDGA